MPLSQQDITNSYQQMLGRTPNQQELQAFTDYANNGYVPINGLQLNQILQSMPEYQTQQLQNFGNQYQNVLGQSDQRILGIAQQNLTGQFAGLGRNPSSSGYLNAYTQAAANLAMGRQQQLANFYAPGYQQIMGNQVGQGNNALNFQNQGAANLRNYQFANQNAVNQQNQYNSYMNGQNTRNLQGALMGGAGSLIGGAVGAIGGPISSAIGTGSGNKVAGLFGNNGNGGGSGGQSMGMPGANLGYPSPYGGGLYNGPMRNYGQ